MGTAANLMNFRLGIRGLVIAALLAAPLGGPALAQEVQRIAAVVNDEAVSIFDVIERAKLVVMTSGLQGGSETMQRIAPQVLRNLIDERLRLQEARRQNISVTDDEIAQAIGMIEKRNNMPADSIVKILETRQIKYSTLEMQVRTEIAWSKLVNRRLQTSVSISEEDIDDEFARIRGNQGRPEYLIAEIFLIVDSAGQDRRVRDNAAELVSQLRGGADFKALARQFSEGATATRGGDIGWVRADQLAGEVASQVLLLQPGEISDPIATGGGYMIVQLNDRRQLSGPDLDDVQLDLKQVLLALPAGVAETEIESQIALAQTIRETVSGCDDMARLAAETDPSSSGDVGTVRLKDLPSNLKPILRDLPIATVSEPVRTDQGIQLFMVCDRFEPESTVSAREQVRQSLFDRQLGQVARHYLRDLRRNAYVEYRYRI